MVTEVAHHGLRTWSPPSSSTCGPGTPWASPPSSRPPPIGVTSLIFLHRRTDSAGQEIPYDRTIWSLSSRGVGRPGPGPDSTRERTWLAAGRSLAPEHRSVVFEVVARLIFHPILVLSVYLLFCAENLPGGGFVGGLVAGVALIVRYLAGGRFELAEAAPRQPGLFTGLGLFVMTAVALLGLIDGTVLHAFEYHGHLPLFGEYHLPRPSSSTSVSTCWSSASSSTSSAPWAPRSTARSSGRRRRGPPGSGASSPPGAARTRPTPPPEEETADDHQPRSARHRHRAVRGRRRPAAHPAADPHPARRGHHLQRHQPAGALVTGSPGPPPCSTRASTAAWVTDPLPQAIALTAIVITLATTAFLLAMAYRSYQLTGTDEVHDDIEDRRIALRSEV